MVQTEDQYVFIHMALLDYMESGETEVDANGLRDYIRKHMQTEHKTGTLIGSLWRHLMNSWILLVEVASILILAIKMLLGRV